MLSSNGAEFVGNRLDFVRENCAKTVPDVVRLIYFGTVRYAESLPKFAAVLFLGLAILTAQDAGYTYSHAGNVEPVASRTTPAYLLAGGGKTTPEAYRWLMERAGGGDAITLRASGADAMNKALIDAGANSAATFLFKSREAASDPFVLERVRKASAIWIAGGDQWNYVRMWRATPLAEAINARIRAGMPIGGSSAGLAVLGEFAFSAETGGITSVKALANPYDPAMTIATNFLEIPLLKKVITDTHWVKRDRQGRTLVMLARLVQDGRANTASAIAVDEDNSVLLESDGGARVSGPGSAYFLRTTTKPALCVEGQPLTFAGIEVYRIDATGKFNVKTWRGEGGAAYRLDVTKGVVSSTQAGGGVY